MKPCIKLIALLFVALILSSCNKVIDGNQENDYVFEEEYIQYDIEQIVFSKSFQSTEPNIELVYKNNKLRLIASLGLSEHSTVSINSLVKKGNEISVHVSGITNKRNLRLAVPQVYIELNKADFKNLDDYKFNIVYDDYSHLKVKHGINDVLNKIEPQFKIISKRLPSIDLIKDDNKLIWSIYYKGIFDREMDDMPLVNLLAQIDANTGEIINSEKIIISSSVDYGRVLDYSYDSLVLYKKQLSENDINSEQAWIYNLNSQEKNMIFSSDYKISSALLNKEKTYLGLIETHENLSSLYILSSEDKRAYKVSFEETFNPKIIQWKDNDTLYLIDNGEASSIVYSYHIRDNESKLIGRFNKNLVNMYVSEDYVVLSEKVNDDINRKILVTTDWTGFRTFSTGFSPKIINNSYLAFLNNDEKNNTNSLIIYCLSSYEKIASLEGNISQFDIAHGKTLTYTTKNTTNEDYSLYIYPLDTLEAEFVTNLMGDKVYTTSKPRPLLLNMALPNEDQKTEIIYSIDLELMNINETP